MNATNILDIAVLDIADIDAAFELITLEEMLALPAMEANPDTFTFAYRY